LYDGEFDGVVLAERENVQVHLADFIASAEGLNA
jgi:hypothetical protein